VVEFNPCYICGINLLAAIYSVFESQPLSEQLINCIQSKPLIRGKDLRFQDLSFALSTRSTSPVSASLGPNLSTAHLPFLPLFDQIFIAHLPVSALLDQNPLCPFASSGPNTWFRPIWIKSPSPPFSSSFGDKHGRGNRQLILVRSKLCLILLHKIDAILLVEKRGECDCNEDVDRINALAAMFPFTRNIGRV
jgi:hypothetical protein